MPILNMNAKNLIGTTVTGVALVKNGAVRIPFRIVKNETGKEDSKMIHLDLGKVGQALFKSAKPVPAITAVAFSKAHYTQEQAAKFLEQLGLSADSIEDTDTGLLAKTNGGPKDGDTLIKMNDTMGMLVSNVQKSFEGYDFDSMSFRP